MQEHKLLSRDDIEGMVQRIAAEIAQLDESEKPNVLVPILTGGMIFASDLMRALSMNGVDLNIGFVKMQRVFSATAPEQMRIVRQSDLTWLVPGGLQDKRVLLVDGIFDTGSTLFEVTKLMSSRGVTSLKVATLLWRNLPHVSIKPDFYGFDLGGSMHYVFGYGMDVNQGRRGLPDIWYEG